MPERQTERSCGPSVRKTPLAEEISIAGLRAQYDTLAGDDTRNRLSEEGTVTYDIRFHMHLPAENGQGCGKRLLFDLETQKEYYVKYRLITRGIYYAARMLSAQKNREFTGSEYSNLKKVYSIWICMNEEKDPGERGSLYRLLNTLLSFSLTPEEKEHILEKEYGISM